MTGPAVPPGTGNPPAADAIVTTGTVDSAPQGTTGPGRHPRTRNPAAQVAAVTTDGGADPQPPAPAGTPRDHEAGAQDVVLTLQQHLLPAGVPVFPNTQLGACHLTGAERPGGGCFDVFALPGGTIALMTGHAAGDGPGAVAAMSQLRTVLRETLLAGAGLDRALPRMDAAAEQAPGVLGACVGIGLLDPVTGSLHYASAGQSAPLVCAPGGRAWALVPGGGGPLGMGADRPALSDVVVPRGSMLVLGSGGYGAPPPAPDGEERLTSTVTRAFAGEDALVAGSAGQICGAVAEGLADWAVGDVTVLAAHHLEQPVPGLFLRLPGEPAALRELRARLGAWMGDLGISTADRVDTELAVYEAAANAIMHGRPREGTASVIVEVQLDGAGGALIEVTDRGRWRVPPPGGRERPGGRGLSVMSKVTGQLTISPSPIGTTVVMRRALSQPVAVGPARRRRADGGA